MHNCIAATVCHLATPQSVATTAAATTVAHTEQQQQQHGNNNWKVVASHATNDIYHVNL